MSGQGYHPSEELPIEIDASVAGYALGSLGRKFPGDLDGILNVMVDACDVAEEPTSSYEIDEAILLEALHGKRTLSGDSVYVVS